MIRRWLFPLALLGALLLAVFSLRTPAPAPVDAPAEAFSAARAMADIRQIARAPHPTGSEENARVRAYLLERMRGLGLEVSTQDAPLSPASAERLANWGDAQAGSRRLVNLIGVLPGQDRTAPALMLMAHHDTTWLSPGAADDSTGVAAILEMVRAMQARGPVRRDVVVLLTDAEELGLDGARAFFEGHPLADRIGFVVNLEARGGGGRASLFETGPGNAETIAAFVHAARGVDGGPTSASPSVAIYERMPNGTDYTIARDRGIAGANFAFVGRASHYHTAQSTPEALDQGSVQHIGAQGLALTDRLARAQALPTATVSSVYGDILGLGVVVLPAVSGWVLLGVSALLAGFAAWRARRAGELTLGGAGRGVLDAVAILSTGLVAAAFVRALSGGPVDSGLDYYVMMGRLLWLEAGVVLALLAIVLALMAGGATRRGAAVGAVAVMTVIAMVVLGVDVVVLVAAIVSAGLWLWPRRGEPQTWGGWLGLMAIVFVLGCALQSASPQVAMILIWPLALAALAAALGALIDPGLRKDLSLVPAILTVLIGGAWLMGMGHQVALGVGMDMPGALALLALLVLMLARPLVGRGRKVRQVMAAVAAVCLIAGAGVALAARIAEPPEAGMPDYKGGVEG